MRTKQKRYREFSLWEKFAVWTGVCTVIGLVFAVFVWWFPSNDPKARGQVMTNSPGGIQAGGSVNFNSERQLIRSLTIYVVVDEETAPQPISEVERSAGIGQCIRLVKDDGSSNLFCTDYTWSRQQVTPTHAALHFVYNPDAPQEILGRDVETLAHIKQIVMGFSEAPLRVQGAGDVRINVLLNGVDVGTAAIKMAAGVFAAKSAASDLGDFFVGMPARYKALVAAR